MSQRQKILEEIYQKLEDRYGPQQWWPADSPFEVMVGAILTQNTNWGNVEKAIGALKGAGVLDSEKMSAVEEVHLSELIRSAGYFRVKAKRLKNLLRFLSDNYSNEIEAMKNQDAQRLRQELLQVSGIGPETADSILLYALEHPFFVVDAYTYRVFSRHFLVSEDADYETMQELAMGCLPPEIYNEFHALLVKVGKEHCRPKPVCEGCPLNGVNWE